VPGERLPSPEWQVRKALEVLRDEAVQFDIAWLLATRGELCDSYRSARGTAPKGATGSHAGPPSLRPSTGQKRCAGCRFVTDAATGGRARCTLYGVDVFPGVLWPHRTEDRKEWQSALGIAEHTEDDSPETLQATVDEWRRGYEREASPVALVLKSLGLTNAA
jgi:hypothetical protein